MGTGGHFRIVAQRHLHRWEASIRRNCFNMRQLAQILGVDPAHFYSGRRNQFHCARLADTGEDDILRLGARFQRAEDFAAAYAIETSAHFSQRAQDVQIAISFYAEMEARLNRRKRGLETAEVVAYSRRGCRHRLACRLR